MPTRQEVLQAAIEKNRQYLAKKDALVYYQKIVAYQAELTALDLQEDLPPDPEVPPPGVQWSGDFAQAVDRFVDALIAKQTADGVDVAVKGKSSGHAYTRAENIALAESIGVLDELGPDFFGPDLGPDVKQ